MSSINDLVEIVGGVEESPTNVVNVYRGDKHYKRVIGGNAAYEYKNAIMENALSESILEPKVDSNILKKEYHKALLALNEKINNTTNAENDENDENDENGEINEEQLKQNIVNYLSVSPELDIEIPEISIPDEKLNSIEQYYNQITEVLYTILEKL